MKNSPSIQCHIPKVQNMRQRSLIFQMVCMACVCHASALQAQVHYHDINSPWGQRADSGPDAEVPGWFYNLGITGLRAQLV